MIVKSEKKRENKEKKNMAWTITQHSRRRQERSFFYKKKKKQTGQKTKRAREHWLNNKEHTSVTLNNLFNRKVTS